MNYGIAFFIIIALFTGIPAVFAGETQDDADNLFSQAEDAAASSNYEEAYFLYQNASLAYADAGDDTRKRDSLRQAKRMTWLFAEMPLNTTGADDTIAATFPHMTSDEREAFLEPGKSIQFDSDGQTWYFEGIARNIMYHDMTLMRENLQEKGESPFFDEIYPLIGNKTDPDNPLYQNHSFIATAALSVPRDQLPENGILQVWVPIPVETGSQTDISVINIEPEEYVVSGPVTTGDVGEVYLEIPLDTMNGSFVNVTVESSFTTSPCIDTVEPEKIGEYDTDGELYRKYTRSQKSINLSPEVISLAQEIVGDETDPYRKAKLIYEYINETLPYSNIPHLFLAAMNMSESDYVHNTGFGDCGTQSAYFAALCRSVGVPARAPGGYQIVPGHQGTHFWAEFYIPGYGWLPADVTVADAGDWAYNATDEQRKEYQDFFFGNLDPYRFTIQTDLDEPFSGEPNPDFLFTIVHQKPMLICNVSDADVEALGLGYFSYTMKEKEEE